MTTTYIRAVRIGKWFPSNDPLAAAIARLVILREDFMLEMHGILADNIQDLDGHSPQWRRTYFFRNSVRTLWEIQGVLTVIRGNREFKRMLARRPQKDRDELTRICTRLNAASDLMKTIRNTLGGHVLEGGVQKALNNIPYDKVGILEVGRVIKLTHFKMAGDLVAEILTDGVPEALKVPKIESDLQKLAELLPVIVRLEQVLEIYLTARRLL